MLSKLAITPCDLLFDPPAAWRAILNTFQDSPSDEERGSIQQPTHWLQVPSRSHYLTSRLYMYVKYSARCLAVKLWNTKKSKLKIQSWGERLLGCTSGKTKWNRGGWDNLKWYTTDTQYIFFSCAFTRNKAKAVNVLSPLAAAEVCK